MKGGQGVRAGMFALIGNIALPASTLITAPILARGLGLDSRGEVAAIIATYTLVVMLATVGMPDALTFYVAKRLVRYRSLSAWSALLTVLGAVAGVIAMQLSASLLSGGSLEVERLLRASSWVLLPGSLVALGRGVSAGQSRWGLVALERCATALVRVVGTAALLLTGTMTTETATWVLILSMVSGGVAYTALRPVAALADDGANFQAFLRYSMNVWLGAVTGVLLSRVDQILLLPLSGAGQLGLYSVAVNIGDVPLIIVATVVGLVLTSDARKNDDGLLSFSSRFTVLTVSLASLAIGLPMVWWVPVVFGSEFSGAVGPAAILLIAVVVQTPGSIAGSALSARGTPQARSWSILVACIVNIALVCLLTPPFGATGAALATLGGLATNTGCCLLLLRRLHMVDVKRFVVPARGDVGRLLAFVKRRGRDV